MLTMTASMRLRYLDENERYSLASDLAADICSMCCDKHIDLLKFTAKQMIPSNNWAVLLCLRVNAMCWRFLFS